MFGVEDERLGEAVGVAIHLVSESTLDQAELTAHLEPRLAKLSLIHI